MPDAGISYIALSCATSREQYSLSSLLCVRAQRRAHTAHEPLFISPFAHHGTVSAYITPPRTRVLAEEIHGGVHGAGYGTLGLVISSCRGETVRRRGGRVRVTMYMRACGATQGSMYARLQRPIRRTRTHEQELDGSTHQQQKCIPIARSFFFHSDPAWYRIDPVFTAPRRPIIPDWRRVIIPIRADHR